MDFPIEEHEERGAAVIAVRGEFDLVAAPSVLRTLIDAFERGADRVLLDLTQVTFFDSSAVATIVTGHVEARERGARFVCACATNVAHKLKLFGLTHLVAVAPDRQTGLAKLDA